MNPLFDGHCDTIYQCYHTGQSLLDRNPKGHLDLNRTKVFRPYAQFFALFEDAMGKNEAQLTQIFQCQYDIFCREIEKNKRKIAFCRTRSQAECAMSEGKAAAFLSVEGADLLSCNLKVLEQAYQMGVRAVNLTWNRANILSGSCVEEKERGLSNLGKEFARRMQDLGVLIDLSHLSDPGFWDVIELSCKPVFASHSNARAVWAHPRNLTDAQFSAIVKIKGVVGLNCYKGFLGEDPDMDTVTAHLEHFLALGGEAHVSIGGDWDGCDALPRGMEDGICSLSRFYEHLLRKNYSETLLNQIFYQNLMRVVGEVCTM